MNRIFYAERDTTIYEKTNDQNTGIDEILELTKITSGSRLNGVIQANSYNTRILIDFGTEITTISQSVVDGNIPALSNNNVNSASIYLSLRAANATDLTSNTYQIEAYPISESWEAGTGRADDRPITKVGSSWLNRSGDAVAQTTTTWTTSSAHSANTGVGPTETKGGGTWITGSGFESSQSFNAYTNKTPDIRMNVTDIVNYWLKSGSSANNGFIVKRPYADEHSGDILGSIKFFSRESHTIFVPRLEVCWDDRSTSGTLNAISSDTYVPYFKNIKAEYRTTDIARFRVGVRPEFPTKTYTTSSFYLTTDHLPTSSSYEIIDSITNDVIIKDEDIFSNSTTKISYDTNGNYFDIRMDTFMPERYYKIKLTCRRTNDTQTFDDFYFKVVN